MQWFLKLHKTRLYKCRKVVEAERSLVNNEASTTSSACDIRLLDTINCPADLKNLCETDLSQVADELRSLITESVSITGGHLGANLGVIELTVAMHYVFDTPRDILIWDVGHQAYAHKILTGRRDRIHTLRQPGGLSGFTKRSESIYDPFGAGHASTSISAALGIAVGRGMNGNVGGHVIPIIGDGAMSGGMAYEAMNHAGDIRARLVVVLNDNGMAISASTGAMSDYLARLVSSKVYLTVRDVGRQVFRKLPRFVEAGAKRAESIARGLAVGGGTIFEELGFYYVGPIDGHDIPTLLSVLENIRDANVRPVLVHVVTKKGKGYLPAMGASEKYHSVGKFNVSTGQQYVKSGEFPTYTDIVADTLITEAKRDEKVVAITAAMLAGTGLEKFKAVFPERTFNVGIAEQHAVTFAAGLAAEGFKPCCAVYSTFLQRAYDQIIHDVALQRLAVRFMIDRAGFVGDDGPTHNGSFDLAYLGCIPGIVVMSPSDEVELRNMVATLLSIDDGPSAVRYPRSRVVGASLGVAECGDTITVGKGRLIKEGSRVAILSIGTRLYDMLEAARLLDSYGLSVTVADARFLKPLDVDLLRILAMEHELLITVEEGAIGGFGHHVLHALSEQGLLDRCGFKVRTCTFPDIFSSHGSAESFYSDIGLNASGVVKLVQSILDV